MHKSYITNSLLHQYYRTKGNQEIAASHIKNTTDYLSWMLIEARNENNSHYLRKIARESLTLYFKTFELEVLKNGVKAILFSFKKRK